MLPIDWSDEEYASDRSEHGIYEYRDDDVVYPPLPNEEEITRNDIIELKDTLRQQLSQVQPVGSFAYFERIRNFVNPGLTVDSLDLVRLPLSESDAQVLIQASHRAPFGHGSETVLDVSVRRTWEMDASEIHFRNPEWQIFLEQIVEKAATQLGIGNGPNQIRAGLYKMLIYEAGAMFKAHRDTEKVPGMFGTLVICLPSEHTGGDVYLQHGDKGKRFDSSEFSAFNASVIAWYADVLHEIEPVKSGYRWVLTYNLINTKEATQSALDLDTRITNFTRILRQWKSLNDGPQYLIHYLEHRYTTEGLTMAKLKGHDIARVHYLAESCAAHGDFFVFLANMALRVTDPNDEDWRDGFTSLFHLTRIVDLEGLDLSAVRLGVNAPRANIVDEISYKDRNHDSQTGGNYLGNGHAQIHQFFHDSVVAIVPKCSTVAFLLGSAPRPGSIKKLIGKLTRCLADNDSASQELLYSVCRGILSGQYERKNKCLGWIAVTAAYIHDASLFKESVEQTTGSFELDSYFDLGQTLCPHDLAVHKDDLIKAFEKSEKLYHVYRNLTAFRGGFTRGNINRNDSYQRSFVHHWLGNILFHNLTNLSEASERDASTLIEIITECSDGPFTQFVLYQGVRKFVDRFVEDAGFINAVMMELLLALREPSESTNFLESLLRPVLEAAACNFDLKRYLSVIRHDGRFRKDITRTLYKRMLLLGKVQAVTLLNKIEAQVSDNENIETRWYVLPFIEELLCAVGVPSPEEEKFFYQILVAWITQQVPKEPGRPSDWLRDDEIWRACDMQCADCLSVNAFLRCAESESQQFDFRDLLHVKTNYKWFHYFNSSRIEVESNAGSDAKGATIILTKTTKHWEEKHQGWCSLAESCVGELEALPQEKLKACLGDRYEEIMNLSVVKQPTTL